MTAEQYGNYETNMASLLKILGDPGLCRSCGAPIFWVTTKTGKKMPVTPAGISHFADCPNAAQHRKVDRPEKIISPGVDSRGI